MSPLRYFANVFADACSRQIGRFLNVPPIIDLTFKLWVVHDFSAKCNAQQPGALHWGPVNNANTSRAIICGTA